MNAINNGDRRVEGDMPSKVYKHGSRYRCRRKTESGWRWCPSAETPEEAVRIAQSTAPDPPAFPEDPAVPKDPALPAQEDLVWNARGDLVLTQQEVAPPLPESVLEPIRIEGPYKHKTGWRCRVVSNGRRTWCPVGKTEKHALKIAEAFAREAARDGRHSVRDALEAYLRHHAAKGSRDRSVQTYRHALFLFFGPVLDSPLCYVTAHRAKELYDKMRCAVGIRTGRPLTVDTCRTSLIMGRSFLAWCVEQHWLRDNPLAKVKTIGTRRKGKKQLTIDESRIMYRVCMAEARNGDDGALAALIAISMGLRAGEIVSRVVRDLDDAGKVLRVDDNPEIGFRVKSPSSRRPVKVPVDLRPLLQARATGKAPGALLLPSGVGRLQWSSWVNRQTERLCKLAGVPRVCAHALRGMAATAAAAAGETPELVARMLGHEGPALTLGHYIIPGTHEQAQRDRGLLALAEED